MATRIHVAQKDGEWGYEVGGDFTTASSRTDAITEATQYVIEQKGQGNGSFFIVVDDKDGGDEPDAVTVDDDKSGSAPRSSTPTPNQKNTPATGTDSTPQQ